MKSIRAHLLVTLLPAVAAVMIAGAVILYFAVRAMLIAQFDAALTTKVRSLASLTTWTSKGIDFDFADQAMPEFEFGPHAEFFEIRLANGDVLERSLSLKDQPLIPGDWQHLRRIWNAKLPDGRPGRMAALSFQPQPDLESESPSAAELVASDAPHVTVVVGRSRGEIDRPMRALAAGLIGAGALMCGAFTLIVLRTVRAGLRPLQHMGAMVEAIDGSSLSFRLDSEHVPVELRPMCVKLNELLARLEEAFARERRFTSAAAHELRTPVSELRTLAEVTLKWPGDSASHGHSMRQVLDTTLQMQQMIETLLSLSRSESGGFAVHHEAIVIRPIIETILRSMEHWIQEKSITCVNAVPAALVAHTDRTILFSILRNILENAVEYTPDGGKIEIKAFNHAMCVDVLVANTNDSLELHHLEYVCEPFWRNDSARSSRAHNGLGMALVRQLTATAGLGMNLALNDHGQFEVRLSIPVLQDARPALVPRANGAPSLFR